MIKLKEAWQKTRTFIILEESISLPSVDISIWRTTTSWNVLLFCGKAQWDRVQANLPLINDCAVSLVELYQLITHTCTSRRICCYGWAFIQIHLTHSSHRETCVLLRCETPVVTAMPPFREQQPCFLLSVFFLTFLHLSVLLFLEKCHNTPLCPVSLSPFDLLIDIWLDGCQSSARLHQRDRSP